MTTEVEVAESILEHAGAITRLDRGELGPRAYQAACDTLIHTVRVLAAPYIARSVDRTFYKAMLAAAAQVAGVGVELQDGVVVLRVDSRTRQHAFELTSAAQLRESQL